MAELFEKDIDILEPEEKEYSLSGSDFFKQHPEKLLAEPYEASGRFGKVIKYRAKEGKKATDVLIDIETPVFIGHGITDISAGKTVIASDPAKEIPTAEIEKAIETAIEKTEKGIIQTARSKKREIQEFDEPAPKPTIPFEDILRTYNTNLTEDEIKAFLWYMHQQGNTFKGKWLNIFNPTLLSSEQESAYINSWVKSGILFYFRGELLPASIYLSENLYERKTALQNDKQNIIDIYGQDAFTAQETKLNEAFEEIYNNRLKLDNPDPEKRLHLKPYGEFTDNLKIINWNVDNQTGEPEPFKVITKSTGEINWYSARSSTRWGDPKRNELSINDAFRWWLKFDNNRPSLPHNFNYEDIFKYYMDKKAVKNIDPTVLARNRALAKDVGDKMFSKFLAEVILENDRVKIETAWNEKFNADRGLRTDKIPIAFEVALEHWNEPLEIKPEKREGIAFATMAGSSLNAYQVGTGKTIVAVLTIAQFMDAGHCKRPVLIVPNQVYKQFYAEMHGLLPHIRINDLYNLGNEYYEKLLDENGNVAMVDEGTITMLTYEGFEQIGFNKETADDLLDQLKDAITQITSLPAGESKAEEKRRLRQEEKLTGILGNALQKTRTNIEDLGFDFVCFDEAHALKNIFSQVKSRPKDVSEDEKQTRQPKMYEISSSTSTRGVKAYMICSYIQLHNNGRNILLLTATPFTNSPLEVYSMLSLVAYQHLKKIGLSNVNDFFDNYCQVSYELVINSRLQAVRKQVFKSFDNLQSLQKLIYKFMLHKEAGKPDKNGNVIALVRPDKWVLPYKGRFNEKNEYLPAKPEEMVDTVIPLTNEQKELMEEIISYVEGDISYDALQIRGQARADIANFSGDEDEETRSRAEEALLDEGSLDDEEKAGVKTLRGVNFARSLALSPYLYEFSGLGEPDYKNYVEKSPKLKYIMECIRSVKKWHQERNEPMSGQVIYMDRGKSYFELVKEYLVKELDFAPHEIGIIRSGKEGSAKHKDFVKNGFNGYEFDEKIKTFKNIPDEKRIKVVIGTSSIREGLNLQRFGTCLYNAFVDWNPTDEIQLEGRMWRQGNSFKNVRIVIPMMSDSMDIFMFQKLEEKTERINSIWDYDGKSNVLKVEELDPRELKMKLVTNPRVIAEIEVEGEEIKINEQVSVIENEVDTAKNIMSDLKSVVLFEKELTKVLKIVEPDKTYNSLDAMISNFERLLKKQDEDEEFARRIDRMANEAGVDSYDYEFLNRAWSSSYGDRYIHLYRSYRYGAWKGDYASIKRAKKTFFDRYNIEQDEQALKDFIDDRQMKADRERDDLARLKSKEFIDERAREIEEERQKQKVTIVPLEERVKEFEKLNYLLGIKSDEKIESAEDFIYTDIEGCPPIVSNKPDISPEGIKKLEACLDKLPQTKDQNIDEAGEYTEERKRLHKNIRAKLMKGLSCRTEREKPVAILMGGVPGCFTGEQLIHTDQGVKKISEIEIGDNVLSYDHVNKVNEYKKVTNIIKYNERNDRLFRIKLKDGTIIEVTENHEFYDGEKYVKIKDLLSMIKR